MGASLFAIQAAMQLSNAANEFQAEGARGRFEKTAFDTNARTARIQAQDALLRGDEAANASRREAVQFRGSQTAGYAGQGVDVSSGTPSAIQSESTAIGETDAATIRNNAWREAWGLKAQADSYERQGNMAKIESKFKRRMTLMTGGLQALNTKNQYDAWKDKGPSYAKVGGRVVPVAPRRYTRGRY